MLLFYSEVILHVHRMLVFLEVFIFYFFAVIIYQGIESKTSNVSHSVCTA